jgi:hypothetical protein
MNKFSILPFLGLYLIGTVTVFGQTSYTIQGKVTDGSNGEPLPSAIIKIMGTSQGATANVQGEFRYTINDSAAHLTISYIGYKSDTILVTRSGKHAIQVSLIPNPIQVAEVVITGANHIR